jgi:hypothetical protein
MTKTINVYIIRKTHSILHIKHTQIITISPSLMISVGIVPTTHTPVVTAPSPTPITTYLYSCIYIYIYIYIHMYACMYEYMHMYIYIYMHNYNIHIYIHKNVYKYVNTFIDIYTIISCIFGRVKPVSVIISVITVLLLFFLKLL